MNLHAGKVGRLASNWIWSCMAAIGEHKAAGQKRHKIIILTQEPHGLVMSCDVLFFLCHGLSSPPRELRRVRSLPQVLALGASLKPGGALCREGFEYDRDVEFT